MKEAVTGKYDKTRSEDVTKNTRETEKPSVWRQNKNIHF